MNDLPYARERSLALEAVREAAVLCRAVAAARGDATIDKSDRSPVTVADFGSQALVCRALRQAGVTDPVIAEEDSAVLREAAHATTLAAVVEHVGNLVPELPADEVCRWIDEGGQRDAVPRFWTLDPIDGTKGFLRGEQYAVALALVEDGVPVVGALACPNLDGTGRIFHASRGGGVIETSLDGDAPKSVAVSGACDASEARFCESVESGHSAHGRSAQVAEEMGIRREPVRMDSQCKYAAVASGRAEIYMRLPVKKGYVEKIWDHAAGVLIVEEAGGRVTDLEGNPLEFHHGSTLAANRGVLATNGALHDRLLVALHAVAARG